MAGSNLQFFTASRAFSSKPIPSERAILSSRGRPSGPTISHRTHVPWYLALRASSEYSGSGVNTARGAETPPPTRNTPPPIPPPRPGPTPGPVPEPTPPPEPEPIPPPDPVPFDIGPLGMAALGSPKFGRLAEILICGGTTTVGSTGNFGAGLRFTTTGGVNCSLANLGSLPWGAFSLSRSPPPPPPPVVSFFLLDSGIYGEMSGATRETVSCFLTSCTIRAPMMDIAIRAPMA